MSKRSRDGETSEAGSSSMPRFAYMLAMDNTFQPIRVDVRLLEHYECRTFLAMKHDQPAYVDKESKMPVYYSWMSRSLLIAFVKSLTVGKMCLNDSVSFQELVYAFEYEGISCPSSIDAKQYNEAVHAVSSGSRAMGIGFRNRDKSLLDSVSEISEAIAAAIVDWPRLEHGLESALHPPCDGDTESVTFTCTPTRCWIRLLQAPKSFVENCSDATYGLCKKRPYWLTSTLYAIASVRFALIRLGKIEADDYSEASFFALEEGVKRDPSKNFFSTRIDVPRAWRDRAKKTLGDAECFAIMVINEITNYGPIEDNNNTTRLSPLLKYARACVALAFKTASSMPRIASIFSQRCEDDKGTTPERCALGQALRAHRIKVVKWNDDEPNALVFPPALRHGSARAAGPAVLLEFFNR